VVSGTRYTSDAASEPACGCDPGSLPKIGVIINDKTNGMHQVMTEYPAGDWNMSAQAGARDCRSGCGWAAAAGSGGEVECDRSGFGKAADHA